MSLPRSRRTLKTALLVSAVALFGGCNLDVAMFTMGRLQVRVLDTNENPVPNIRADLLLDDKLTVHSTTTTDAQGFGEFDPDEGGVLIQGYYVRLILTPDWNLRSGEPNDKPVIPSGGSTIVVRFHIQKVATP